MAWKPCAVSLTVKQLHVYVDTAIMGKHTWMNRYNIISDKASGMTSKDYTILGSEHVLLTYSGLPAMLSIYHALHSFFLCTKCAMCLHFIRRFLQKRAKTLSMQVLIVNIAYWKQRKGANACIFACAGTLLCFSLIRRKNRVDACNIKLI